MSSFKIELIITLFALPFNDSVSLTNEKGNSIFYASFFTKNSPKLKKI